MSGGDPLETLPQLKGATEPWVLWVARCKNTLQPRNESSLQIDTDLWCLVCKRRLNVYGGLQLHGSYQAA